MSHPYNHSRIPSLLLDTTVEPGHTIRVLPDHFLTWVLGYHYAVSLCLCLWHIEQVYQKLGFVSLSSVFFLQKSALWSFFHTHSRDEFLSCETHHPQEVMSIVKVTMNSRTSLSCRQPIPRVVCENVVCENVRSVSLPSVLPDILPLLFSLYM